MSETKHTPGPWYVRDGYIYGRCEGGSLMQERDFWIAEVRGWGHLQYRKDGAEMQDANARLIAAAPDLLEACEHALAEIEELCGIMRTNQAVIDRLRAAIAKATGGQP